MANKRISELPSASGLTGSELMEVTQASESRQVAAGEIARLPFKIYALASTAHTLIAPHAQALLETTASVAQVVSIPLATSVPFATGVAVNIVQIGTGAASITAVSGVTLNGVNGGTATINAQFGGVSIYKRPASNAWSIQGDHGGVT